jgi:hypothetical protein
MVLVLIGGLWTVLEIGGYLVAPEDLAGKWQLQSTGPTSDEVKGPGLNIEQSGKFFQVSFEHGPQLDLKLQSGSPMVLAGSNCSLTVTGHMGGDDKTLQLEGPLQGKWTAHRLTRTFPLDPTTKEAR